MARRNRKRRQRLGLSHLENGNVGDRFTRVVQVDHSQPRSSNKITFKTGTQRVWTTATQVDAKQQWKQTFAADPIDLTHLPKPIVIKTRQILAALEQGVSPAQLQGKRFSFDRTLLRIPVTYRYRLLCRWYCDRMSYGYFWCMSKGEERAYPAG
ncbi:MAG: hypothetical protein NW224_05295 [Leptolyngbyaceae cyanobacterium bins.302]|nr:hypothetical protein [Leptolyngbyaceae cyanobacterium bins.302]